MEHLQFTVDEDSEGLRLDKYISDMTGPLLSRSFLQKIIKNNEVFVNSSPKKPSYKVALGDDVYFTVPDAENCNITPEDIPLDILYEDDDVIVVNKPKGMVVHPAAGHFEHTLVNALMYHCGDSLSGINGVMRPGIVHRIDMNTTGSIIACKNDNAHIKIAAQLKEHSINRTYIAIVCGNIMEDELTINAPLGRSSKDRKKMAVVQGGKNAITHVFVRQRFGAYTLVECKLETGRTHQIRVHMASINHPILGDDIYGKASNRFKTDGQALHAYKLGFVHPTSGEYIETVAPIPDYMNRILVELKT